MNSQDISAILAVLPPLQVEGRAASEDAHKHAHAHTHAHTHTYIRIHKHKPQTPSRLTHHIRGLDSSTDPEPSGTAISRQDRVLK